VCQGSCLCERQGKFMIVVEGASFSRDVTFSEENLELFAALTGDYAPIHFDKLHAQLMGFKGKVVHGFLVASIYSEMLGCHQPGPGTVIQKIEASFLCPVYIGETIHYCVKIKRISEAANAVILELSATNASGVIVNRGDAVCVMKSPTFVNSEYDNEKSS
jgi:3-hydroxybutyryl-CoA dehydratase